MSPHNVEKPNKLAYNNVHNKSTQNLCFWNAQGLCNKIDYLNVLSSDYNFSVIAIAEHWLKTADASFLSMPGYKLASFYGRPTKIHGGTAIFVKENVDYIELIRIRNASVEMVCEATAVEFIKEKIVIISVYRPYNDDTLYFKKILKCLYNIICLSFKPGFSLVVCGDFNVNFRPESDDSFRHDLINMFDSFGLNITTTDVTRPSSGRCIDNVVTNIHMTKGLSKVVHTVVSDHNAIVYSLASSNAHRSNVKKCKNLVRLVNDFSIQMFIHRLREINWIDVYSIGNINDNLKIFHDLFLWAVNGAFKLLNTYKRITKPDNKWYNRELQILKDQCDMLFNLSKAYNNQCLRDRYKILKKQYKIAIRNAKVTYFNGLIQNSQNKSKKLWQVTNMLTNVDSTFCNSFKLPS